MLAKYEAEKTSAGEMNTSIKLILSSILFAFFSLNSYAGLQEIDDFALLDHNGYQHRLSWYGHKKAIILMPISSDCRLDLDRLRSYKLLHSAWAEHGVELFFINSSEKGDRKSLAMFASNFNIDFPILDDDAQLVAENLGIDKTGEIIVIEPTKRKVLYRGSLDDRLKWAQGTPQPEPTLHNLIENFLANSSMPNETIVRKSEGCPIRFPAKEKHSNKTPDYASDVAPLLERNCIACHVNGGIGPFAMNSYDMVRGWAPMIRETVMTKRMPPVQVDPNIQHFNNARYLSKEDKQTLIHWIDAGAPRGEGSDPLSVIKPLTGEWDLGEPDYIVEVPPYTVPATGVLDYINLSIDLPFEEDKYVRAVQYLPGDKRVLHHLLTYITPVGDEKNISYQLEGYAPGREGGTIYPANTGVALPKNHQFTMSIHYTTIGKEVTDKTRIGLYFHDEPPKSEFLTTAIFEYHINVNIPAQVLDFDMSSSHFLDKSINLYAMRPHMHFRGKRFSYKVIYPDNTSEILLNVPNYSFAWQPNYRLAEPKLIPAGSRIMINGAYDNSKYNLGNPDPSVEAKGGEQSWNEMFIGYFSYVLTE